jgi:hypothetical protein
MTGSVEWAVGPNAIIAATAVRDRPRYGMEKTDRLSDRGEESFDGKVFITPMFQKVEM